MRNFLPVLGLIAITALASAASRSDTDGRIVNGWVVKNFEKANFIVRLEHESGTFCGGGLISAKYVLTAAHCLDHGPINEYTVYANSSSLYEGISRKISKVFVHDEYSNVTKHSDIAVVRLDEAIQGLRTLLLCEKPLKPGNNFYIFGWGQTQLREDVSDYLRTNRVTVRSPDVCATEYKRFVSKNMLCASGNKEGGICSGDSGGPAVYKNRVYAVNAMTYKCSDDNRSDAYADVCATRQFILDAMHSEE